MNVSTDPRLVKQLLLSHWTAGANPLAGGASSVTEPEGSSGLFDLLLSQLLGSSASSPETPAIQPVPYTGLSAISAISVTTAGAVPVADAVHELQPDSGRSSAFDNLINAAASKYCVDSALIKGVIQQESSFNPDAVSKSGAKGLMQLMDATARGLAVTDSFDPAQNIDGGTRFLSYLLRKYDNNVSAALAAYNAGPGRVDRLGIATDRDVQVKFDTLPQETQNYIGKVLDASRRWSTPA